MFIPKVATASLVVSPVMNKQTKSSIPDKAGEFIIKNGAFMFMHRIVYQYSDAPNDIIYKGMFSFEININIDRQGKAYFFVESINNSIIQ